MKNVLIFLLLIIATVSNAQIKKSWGCAISGNINKSVYAKNGYNAGIAGTVYTPKFYYLAINNHQLKYTALRKPSDYSSGFLVPDKSDDKFSITTLSIGKLIKTSNKHIRIGLEGGISKAVFSESYFTPIIRNNTSSGSGGFFDLDLDNLFSTTPSHSIKTIDRIKIGYDVKAKIDIPINNSIGLAVAYWQNFNKYKRIGMFEFTFYCGMNLMK